MLLFEHWKRENVNMKKFLQEIERLRTEATPREIKFLSVIERLRTDREKWKEDWLKLQTQVNEQGEKIERLNAYVEEWKTRYETARQAHEEGRAEIGKLQTDLNDARAIIARFMLIAKEALD